MRLAAVLALAVTCAPACGARAADFSLGLGYDDLFGQGGGAPTLGMQMTTDPIWQLGRVGIGLGASAEADTEGDLWAGGGVTATWPLRGTWRFGGSVMAGFYAFGDAAALVSAALTPPEWRARLLRPPALLALAVTLLMLAPHVAWIVRHWDVLSGQVEGQIVGAGDDLGSDLEFRTRIGVSRAIGPPWRLGLAIEHKSNGGIGGINPGIETIFLVVSRPF